MASLAAKEVAKEVIETVRRGKRPNLGKIIKSKGYSANTATVPTQVTNTKSYREVLDPFVAAMEQQRQRAIEAIASRNLSKDKTRDLTDLLDKLTKNIQLLSGGKTANDSVHISWE